MTKSNILLTVTVVVASCLIFRIYAESSVGGSTGQQSPKKIRVLGPAATKLFRLLHNTGVNNNGGVGGAGDDDDLFIEDESYLQKRQYDDYGHMRFGKRQAKGDFDDYGHLRFGK